MNTQGTLVSDSIYGYSELMTIAYEGLGHFEVFRNPMPPKNAPTNRLLPPLDVNMRAENTPRHSRLSDYEATGHLASGFNPDMFNSGSPLTDFETDDESGANQADAAEGEVKSKEDIPKTPTATRLPSLKGTPLKQGGSASIAVSDAFSSLT